MALAWVALARHRSSCRSAVNWAATKRILEVSWSSCLRRYGASAARPRRITISASAPIAPFLVPPKLSTSAHVGQFRQRAVQRGGRVGQPRPVQVQAEVAGVAEVGDLPQLGERVAGAELGRLGEGDHAGLGPVVVTPPGQLLRDELRRDLPVRCRHREELGADQLLRRAALVGVDVRGLGADDRLVPAQQQAQPEDVGAAAVQHQEGLVGTEDLAQPGAWPPRSTRRRRRRPRRPRSRPRSRAGPPDECPRGCRCRSSWDMSCRRAPR